MSDNPPAESDVEEEVPEADDHDGGKVGSVDVESKPIHLDVQEEDAQGYSCDADEVELRQTLQTSEEVMLSVRDGAEGPNLIPEEVIEDGDFSGNELAQGEIPAEQKGRSQEKDDEHVDDHSAGANDAELCVSPDQENPLRIYFLKERHGLAR